MKIEKGENDYNTYYRPTKDDTFDFVPSQGVLPIYYFGDIQEPDVYRQSYLRYAKKENPKIPESYTNDNTLLYISIGIFICIIIKINFKKYLI